MATACSLRATSAAGIVGHKCQTPTAATTSMCTAFAAQTPGKSLGRHSTFSTEVSNPREALRRRRGRGSVRVVAEAAEGQTARAAALRAFSEKRAVKIIAGLHNFDAASVTAVVVAADKGGATHVDIACDPELFRLATSLTRLPVMVSAVEPELFVAAVEAGANMVEIGNYDCFYKDGRTFSADEVLELTKRTRRLLPKVAMSVTVPHTLPLHEQVKLAEELELCGADVIQTEGGTSAAPSSAGVLGMIEKAAPTLAAAYSISHAVGLPVMCASGLSAVTVPMAFAAGAAGVGIGSAVNKLNSEIAMIAAVRSLVASVSVATPAVQHTS